MRGDFERDERGPEGWAERRLPPEGSHASGRGYGPGGPAAGLTPRPRPNPGGPPEGGWRDSDLDRLCGPAAVTAAFAVRPDAVLRLFYTASRKREAGPVCALMAKAHRPYREVTPEEIVRIAGTEHHGGIVAIAVPREVPELGVGPFPQALLAAPVLPLLDGIGNPHNLGAIARSAAFFGCTGLLLSGDPRQAGLSDAAYRTAEGGLEHLTLMKLANPAIALRALAPKFTTVAAVAAGGVAPSELPRTKPFVLVLGNEERGLPGLTIAACAHRVTLPGSGHVQSLNVSVAAAVLIHAMGMPGGKMGAKAEVPPPAAPG
ncbi:TrmH family RNA methyltransferase [Falsiroseomonas algicola]|uniref:TrmH family RNA methyltransferase n=1 Tax=Falsiroseomonas algicola TaxID=2716930 RepID=UPI002E28D147|nr:RNA methyltransferase [Falsiroseomonas algicola]